MKQAMIMKHKKYSQNLLMKMRNKEPIQGKGLKESSERFIAKNLSIIIIKLIN